MSTLDVPRLSCSGLVTDKTTVSVSHCNGSVYELWFQLSSPAQDRLIYCMNNF